MVTARTLIICFLIIVFTGAAIIEHSQVEKPNEIDYRNESYYQGIPLPADFPGNGTISVYSPKGVVPMSNNSSTILVTGMGRWTVESRREGADGCILKFTGFFENLTDMPDLYIDRTCDNESLYVRNVSSETRNEHFYVRNATEITREIGGHNYTYLVLNITGNGDPQFDKGLLGMDFGVIDKDTYNHDRVRWDVDYVYKDVDKWISQVTLTDEIMLCQPYKLTEQDKKDNKVWRIGIRVRC